MRKLLFILPVLFVLPFAVNAQNYTSYHTGSTSDLVTNPQGGICLMGGASEHDEAMKWFLNRSGGGDIIVLRTLGSDGYNNYMYSQLGVSINSVETIVCHNVSASNEQYIIDQLSKAEAVWFAGGDQWEYISFWRNTPIDSVINKRLTEGLVIGGTSAGMAIQGSIYFSAENGTITSSTALSNPFHSNMTVDSNAFIKNEHLENVITDTHYDNPDRKGRHVAFIAKALTAFNVTAKGIACDEYTAVCIDPQGIASVYGDYPSYDENAYFIQINCDIQNNFPETFAANQNLEWNQSNAALKVYQVKGTPNGSYTFDLNDWKTGVGGTWNNWYVSNGVLMEEVSIQPNCNLSIGETVANVVVYPNPTADVFAIECSQTIESVVVCNHLGIEMKSIRTNQDHVKVDLCDFQKGAYVLSIQTSGKLIRRIVVLH